MEGDNNDCWRDLDASAVHNGQCTISVIGLDDITYNEISRDPCMRSTTHKFRRESKGVTQRPIRTYGQTQSLQVHIAPQANTLHQQWRNSTTSASERRSRLRAMLTSRRNMI
eukprot:4939329-Amphidinium_carterae.1